MNEKVKILLEFGAKVKVISEEITPKILEELESLSIESIQIKKFEESDLSESFLVVAATGNRELNDEIVALCEEKKILSNNATSKDKMAIS